MPEAREALTPPDEDATLIAVIPMGLGSWLVASHIARVAS
jgi:hypothetical protein